MKNILLSSAAIVAFAGAAAAEVSWSADAELGYNDDVEDGVYWSAGLGVSASQELNNGFTASASLDIDLDTAADGAFSGIEVDASDWVVTLENDAFALSFGDVDTAVESFSFVSAADEDIAGDEASDFAGADAGILLTGTVGAANFALSTIVDGSDTGAMQAFVGGEFGNFNAGLLYTEEDTVFGQAEAVLVSLGATFGGADLLFNAGEIDDVTVYGLEVTYPVGPVTLGAYYLTADVAGDSDAYGISADYEEGAIAVAAFYEEVFGDDGYGLEASYDLGNGLVVGAGYIGGDNEGDDQAAYIVAEYDLGGGASLLASYADAEIEGSDDIDTGLGGYELLDGLTLELSLEF